MGGFVPPGGVVHIYSLSVILFTQKSVARSGNPTKLLDKMNQNIPISESSDFCKCKNNGHQVRRPQQTGFEGVFCLSKA